MTNPSRESQKKFRSFQVLPSLALLLSVMLSEAAFGGFTYFYTDPALPGANVYIDSATNVEISGSGGIRFYQVSRGGPAHKSGEIVYKFDFASEIQNASLLANAPVWRWSYGYGSSFIHGSKDGQNWVELASAPVPAANGQSNSGAINGPLPASLLGGNSLYIRTTLNNYSNTPQFFRDTAQHSRAALGGANPVFKLDVNTDLAPLPGGGGTSFDPGPGVVFGDPGTASNDLSQQHRLSAQSLAGSEAIHRTNTITRSFTVSRDDELLDPTMVYVGALLDGQLLVDNGGVASVEASFHILDNAGNTGGRRNSQLLRRPDHRP